MPHRGLIVLGGLMVAFFPSVVFGATTPVKIHDVTDGFQQMADLSFGQLVTPTVVEVVFPKEEAGAMQYSALKGVIIMDRTSNALEPTVTSYESLPVQKTAPVVSVSAPEAGMSSMAGLDLLDQNRSTFVAFPLPDLNVLATALVTVRTEDAETLSGFTFVLDNNVVAPIKVSVSAVTNGVKTVVLAPIAPESGRVLFPRTKAEGWEITFWYTQPLRIAELGLDFETKTLQARHVKFLAQPEHVYRLYTEPDRGSTVSVAPSTAQLSAAVPVMSVPVGSLQKNPYYRPVDSDVDGMPDGSDNCPSFANSDQLDVNKNAVGDACEDFDKDGLSNTRDNCQNIPNPDQRDTDGDGLGDKCDQEESRFTERHAWVPWAGMGIAVLVLVALFALTAGRAREEGADSSSDKLSV